MLKIRKFVFIQDIMKRGVIIKNVKNAIFNLIREDDENTIYGNIFDWTIISLIIVNILLVFIDTFEPPQWFQNISNVIEFISIIIFTVEYIMRLWTADLKYPEIGAIKARIIYIFSFMAIIDLLAILPFYLPFVFPIDLRILRALRILRLFRLFKVSRYTTAFYTIGIVFKRKAHQLISSVFVVALLMVIASLLMYNVEHDAQPDVFSNAFSGLWWAVATLTTVGYGDIFPITALGKFLSAVIALLGIGLVAVPSGIISAGFIEIVEKDDAENNEEEDKKQYCPYCGHKID